MADLVETADRALENISTAQTYASHTVNTAQATSALMQKLQVAESIIAKAAPQIETIAPIIEKVAVPLAVGAGGVKAINQISQGDGRGATQTVVSTGSGIGCGLAGAEIGTVVMPGVGTVVGGLVGGAACSAAGQYAGGKLYDGAVVVRDGTKQALNGIYNYFSGASGAPPPTAAPQTQLAANAVVPPAVSRPGVPQA